ncbi:MAG: hypothetical protein Q7S00_03855, partial [bacterium]|nr:hypothetical protein [bacterium]
YQLGRFYLDPGKVTIDLVPNGPGETIRKTVTLSEKRPTVLFVPFLESGSASRLIGQKRGENDRERRLLDPIQLARVRMEQGDYTVEFLLRKGLRQSHPSPEGVQLLVLLKTVQGDYFSARQLAEKEKGPIFSKYKNQLLFLEGIRADEASGEIPLKSSPDLINGFHYYLAGLGEEKKQNFEKATHQFVKAYELGLIGKVIEDKTMATYQKTGDAFKKSKEGKDLLDRFVDLTLSH